MDYHPGSAVARNLRHAASTSQCNIAAVGPGSLAETLNYLCSRSRHEVRKVHNVVFYNA